MDEDRETQSDLSAFDGGSDDSASDGAERTRNGRNKSNGSDSPESTADRPEVREMDRDERIELGVDLLAHVETDELSLSDAVDRIETVTTSPALTREILDTAELRGVIDREEGRIQTRRGGTFVRFESQVVKRDGDFDCRRCGAGLSTGHFIRFDAGELGPFGSSCIKKVLGRE
ncbi:hypothetical protein C499_02000 [Halogeometricum borinquense DSM 11551]|uniref:Uncharacterized protein n=3 Tax=Halogeometricum borinquense TaxID=60847 RepID=E4NPD7_HALBP|nr:hypothetical protein Hbor_08970 [Halogeometricum borinquense DSM 11551]ELY31210.1 hypothetical protein C499_02000 [Halogeometricum borinquense DSM 11551]RYJ14356.1 hypothetical protein ELS19_10605 [Halogeometricum borinquense]